MDRTRWIIFAVIVIAAITGLFVFSKGDDVDVSNVNPNQIVKEGEFKDNVYGNANAKVTLVEYGDFQCPACGSAFPIVKSVKEKYKDNLGFVYRNFPLTNIHPNALAAATTAEAAGRQGKFWEMHDMLFERQSMWENASAENRTKVFEGYAKEIGLDMAKYQADLTSPEVSRRVTYHRALAGKVGANSTPTFVLNGRQLTNNEYNSAEAFEKAIVDELKKAGVQVPASE